MSSARKSLVFVPVAVAGLITSIAGVPVSAADWRWTATPYIWASDIGVDVAVDDRTLVDTTIRIADLLEDVETIAQVRLDARRDGNPWAGLFLDVFDVTLADEPATVTLPNGSSARLESEMGMTLLDLGGVVDPQGDGQGLQFLYGARLLNQRATIDATVASSPSGTAHELEIDETLVDALIGVRYRREIGERFQIQAQADVSTGGTERTWSAGPTLGWKVGRSTSALLGYRHMVIDFDTSDADAEVDATMTLSGVVAGLQFTF
jgi:hypothetical protein